MFKDEKEDRGNQFNWYHLQLGASASGVGTQVL